MLDKITDWFKTFPQVRAVGIGGSTASGYSDPASDIDLYIFTDKDVPVAERMDFIGKISSRHEVGQDYFGPDDEFFYDEIGREIDCIYFDTSWIEDMVDDIWIRHDARNGYTTCFFYTIRSCTVLFDKDGWLKDMKDKIGTDYPEELRENIIRRNMLLLQDKPFSSYSEQIAKAVKRKDSVSIIHRTAAFLESYFDIIFAVNGLLHPGEKRLVGYALKNCRALPEGFENNINALLSSMSSDKDSLPRITETMVQELKKTLVSEGLCLK